MKRRRNVGSPALLLAYTALRRDIIKEGQKLIEPCALKKRLGRPPRSTPFRASL